MTAAATDLVTEHWFYHLEHASLESVMPMLLEKSLERGWTCLVKTSEDQMAFVDELLWKYREDSFLPHGRDDEPFADLQPVLISSTSQEANGADIVLISGGDDVADLNGVSRCMFMINGRNEDDVQNARKRWSRLKASGAKLAYYQQDDRGRWQKKAET